MPQEYLEKISWVWFMPFNDTINSQGWNMHWMTNFYGWLCFQLIMWIMKMVIFFFLLGEITPQEFQGFWNWKCFSWTFFAFSWISWPFVLRLSLLFLWIFLSFFFNLSFFSYTNWNRTIIHKARKWKKKKKIVLVH